MSTLNTTNLKHPGSASSNIALDSSGNTRITAITDSAGANRSTPAAIANGTCKAWVNFNGTGTIAIRASYNISSITDGGTGSYTAIFTTAMPDANYAVVTGGPNGTNGTNITALNLLSVSAASFVLQQTATGGGTGGLTDSSLVCAAVFR